MGLVTLGLRLLPSPPPPDLPVELVQRIIECLCESTDCIALYPPVFKPPVARQEAADARRVGLACCLVSKAFLPLGRRILYSHVTNLDGDARLVGMLERVEKSPHLGALVRSYSLSNEFASGAMDDARLTIVQSLCPNLRTVNLLGRLSSESDDLEMHEGRLLDVLELAFPTSSLVGHLQSLTISSLRLTATMTLALVRILDQHSSLRSLSLEYSELPMVETEPIPDFDLPNLRRLVVTICPQALSTALVLGAPNLTSLDASSLFGYGMCDLPTLSPDPRPALTHLKLQVVESDLSATTPRDPLTPLNILTSFISHFPHLTHLDLGWHTHIIDPEHPLATSSPSASPSFLLALPPTLQYLALGGSLHPTGLALRSLLALETFLPNLGYLEINWSGTATVAAAAALAVECRKRGIRMRGALWLAAHRAGESEEMVRFKEAVAMLRESAMNLVDRLALPLVAGIALRRLGLWTKWYRGAAFVALLFLPRRFNPWFHYDDHLTAHLESAPPPAPTQYPYLPVEIVERIIECL